MQGFGPNGSRPIAALPEWRVWVYSYAELEAEDSQFNTLYAATYPFISQAVDVPPNQPYNGTLGASIRIDKSCVSGDGFTGFVLNVSELVLNNATGLYDSVTDEGSVNGQEIVLSVGEIVDGEVVALSQFEEVARLTGERWRINRSKLTIELGDPAARLDVPVQTGVYLGTGGLEGDAELTGKRRPYGDGVVFNATPQQVIGSEGLWQYSTGATASLDAVKDGGAELTLVSDYATVALLRAANTAMLIPPGSYGSSAAESYFCVGGAAFNQITCDFTGLRLTTADIVEEVALTSAGLDATEIETWTFEKLNTDQPATIGYYLDSDSSETCREMFTKLMKGVHGHAGMSARGLLEVMRIELPGEIASEYYDINGKNLVSIDHTDLPSGIDPPPRRHRVTYANNWTQQTNLYGQVSEGDPALADYLGKPHKLASSSEEHVNDILADYPNAADPEPQQCWFAYQADALEHVEFLDEFYAPGLKAYRFTGHYMLFKHWIGEVLNVRDSSENRPRLMLSAGKYLRLVSVDDDIKSRGTKMIGIGR